MESLNLKQLLTNPTGRYSAYMSARYKIIEDLNNRYGKLIKKHSKFKFHIYKQKTSYIFWFRIPSENFDKLFYDVFIEFKPNIHCISDYTIENYDIKLFSNSPAFMFTYTYVLNDNKMIVQGLKDKCSKEALKNPPTMKNPVEVYGFEKSCYFACKFISDNKLINKNELEQNKKNITKEIIRDKCKSQEEKLIEYNKVKRENQKSRTTKEENTNSINNSSSENKKNKQILKAKVIKPITKANKKTKTVKKIKKKK